MSAFAWARGLGSKVIYVTAVGAAMMIVVVAAMVFILRDTPPVNAAIHHDSEGGMDGLLEGTLVPGRECITVRADDQTWVPIFPSDSIRQQHDAFIIDGSEYRAGDAINLGGGEVSAAPQGSRVPADCPTGPFWLVSSEG